jgi:S1-C subfamily serine protease
MANARRIALAVLAFAGAALSTAALGQATNWPWLGVVISDISAVQAEILGGRDSGSLVTSVENASPALAAGMRRYDLILAMDGHPAANARELTCLIQGRRPGDVVQLTVVRAGRQQAVTVRLGHWPSTNDFPPPAVGNCGRDKVSAL